MRFLAIPATVLLVLGPAEAQLGHSVGFKVDVQTAATSALAATYDGCFGVARDSGGSFWVTARRATAAGAHKLLKFDSAGAFVQAYDQPAGTSASSDGLRDLAYDAVANVLYAGCEASASGGKLFAFNVTLAKWDTTLNWTVPSAITTSVVGLAFDQYGAAGQGSMYASDPGGAVTEFKKDGTVIRTMPAQVPGCTGIAIDAAYRNLWFAGQGGTGRANTGVVLIQVDALTSQKTGVVLLGDSSIPGTPPGGLSGGLEFVVHSHTDHNEPWLLIMAQATKDTIYELYGRFQVGTTCGGLIGCKNDAAYFGNTQWTVTLRGSNAANAFLMLAATDQITPVTPPLFGLGCALQVPLTPAPITIGPIPVIGGAASVTIPVTGGVGGEVWFQWIEVTNPITLPIILSDGGGIVVHS